MAAHAASDLQRLVAQRNALAQLSHAVVDQAASGALATAVDTVGEALAAAGALAYRIDGRDLELVAELRLPRKAKPWLKRLPLDDEPWFVAQSVARELTTRLSTTSGGTRDGHSAQRLLVDAGWRFVAAAPVAIARQVLGVLVVGGAEAALLDEHAQLFLETAGNVLALALVRERELERRRDDGLREAKTAQLATIGLLASTVACDLASPLGRLELQAGDQVELLRELGARLVEPPAELAELRELAADIAAGVRTAQGITSRLLGYSERSKLEPLDLGVIVREAAHQLRPSSATRGIAFEVRTPAEPLRVIGRRESLQLLLVQLLLHGASACGPGRRGSPQVRLSATAEATGHAVTLETSGGAAAVRAGARAFEPFVARERGEPPADLGLWLARQTVLAHNGHIELAPSQLGGASVRVVFPSARSAVPRRRDFSCRPSAPPASSDGRVPAVVWLDEDELFVRGLQRYLKGHAVHTARTLDGAKQLLRGLGELPELVFCDVALAGGGAVELHRSVPPFLAARFVFLTAGVIPAEAAQYLIRSGRPTLIKPVTIEEIASLLAATGSEPGARSAIAATLDGSSRPPSEDEPGGETGEDALPSTLPDGGGARRRHRK